MKKILVLGGPRSDYAEADELQELADFTRESIQSAAAVDYCYFDELGFIGSHGKRQIVNLRSQTDLADYDVIWFRGKFSKLGNLAAAVAEYAAGAQIVNRMYMRRRTEDHNKTTQMLALVKLGLPTPDSVACGHPHLVKLAEKHLSYPMVVKDCYGSHGHTNYLVHKRADFEKVLREHPTTHFIAQEFIKSEGDFRVLLLGEEVLIIHRKAQGDTHLNNTSQGATASLVEPAGFPQIIIDQARQFAAAYDYEISGIDVIIDRDTQQHYFIENNSQPQLFTGAFLEEKKALFGNYFQQLLSNREV